jgi:lipoate-protein ligase B
MSKEIEVRDLGRLDYRSAWATQEQAHAAVLAGGSEIIFLVEHPPVVTLGRREDSVRNLLTPAEQLSERGIELVHSDRGGDITYHGPGQLVAYPIIRLSDHGLSVSGYVHRLEALVIETLKDFGIVAWTDPAAVGVWVGDQSSAAKICAIGVRIRRGVTLHGLALNVATDLSGFENIVPCGLNDRAVTSMEKVLGAAVDLATVKTSLASHLQKL